MSVADGRVARIVTYPATQPQSTAYHSIRARRERANRLRTPDDAITDPSLSSAGLRFLLLIKKAGGTLYETQQLIAEILGVSRMTVHRVAKYLRRAGYLIIRRGHPNGYILNDGCHTPEEVEP